ncbi:unnamed protein product [Caenorhabditis auriculariae]|uniref:Uncharacterized protein n=1 Tax=Caenorhabditis auriculariae TaxID=2777116 RepID=A0A8S1HPA1_9PELO|nr:unnamed protein product [Caenorhabditis auriculariae]
MPVIVEHRWKKTRTVIHEFANQTATVNFSTEAVQSRGPIMVQMPSGRSYNLVDLFAEPMAIRTFGKTPEKAVSLIVLDILRKINVTEPSYRSYSTSSSTKQFIYVGDSLLEGLAMLCFRGISFPEKSRDADEMRLRKHILDVLRNKYERIRSDNMERMRQGKSVDSPLLENVQDDSLCLNTPKMEYMNDDLWPEENFCSNAQSWSTEDCERYGNFSNDCSRKREVSSPSEMTEIKRAYSEEPENQLNS